MDGLSKARVRVFDATKYLATPGMDRRIIRHKAKEPIFVQGGLADSVYYILSGRAKLTVVSKQGKEATVTLLNVGDFVGEESLSPRQEFRKATASTITPCFTMKIEKREMLRVLHEEHEFSDLFVKFMLARSLRIQADLVDQLFNSSEKRLARTLLLMAEYGKPGAPEAIIPSITQETLAEIIAPPGLASAFS